MAQYALVIDPTTDAVGWASPIGVSNQLLKIVVATDNIGWSATFDGGTERNLSIESTTDDVGWSATLP